jgi:hypothetical protein
LVESDTEKCRAESISSFSDVIAGESSLRLMPGKSGGRSNLGRAGCPEASVEDGCSPMIADMSMIDSFLEEELGSGGRSGKESDDSAGGGAAELGGGGRFVRASKLSKELPEKGSPSADIRDV